MAWGVPILLLLCPFVFIFVCFVLAKADVLTLSPYQDMFAGPRKGIFFAGIELDEWSTYLFVWAIVFSNTGAAEFGIRSMYQTLKSFVKSTIKQDMQTNSTEINEEQKEEKRNHTDIRIMESIESLNISIRVFYNFAALEFFYADIALKLMLWAYRQAIEYSHSSYSSCKSHGGMVL